MTNEQHSVEPVELRISSRILLRRPVQIRKGHVTMMYAISTDVSEHGMGILASQEITVGQRCTFSFDVTSDGIKSTITVDGTVCYNRAVTPRGIRTGITKLKAHPSSAYALARFLKN